MTFDLDMATSDYLREEAGEPRARKIGRYWPSDLIKCYRQWYWTILQTPSADDYEEDRQGIFTAGNLIERYVGDILQKKVDAGEITYITPQRHVLIAVDIEKPIWISGKSDFLIEVHDKFGTWSELIEVKSTASVSHTTEPQLAHKAQIMPYLLALEPSKGGTIAYYEKNNVSRRKIFKGIQYDEIFMEYLFERTKVIDRHLRTAELPFPEAKYCKICKEGKLVVDHTTRPKSASCPKCGWKGKWDETDLWQCNYCPFKHQCDDVEAAREAGLPKVPLPELPIARAGAS